MRLRLAPLWIAYVIIIAFGVLFFSVYVFREPLGSAVWKNLHSAEAATALNGSDPELLFSIGNYYFGGGAYDTRKAEIYFRGALEIDPSLPGAHYQLARVYFIRGDFYLAEIEIQKELELHPDFSRSYYVLGLIHGYSGRLKEAETAFKEFLKWKPDSWAGNNDLAWIYFQEGKYAEARDAALAGLKITPNNPWLLNALGVALLNIGDKNSAKGAFEKALAVLNAMNESDWGKAYPGNDPGIYAEGYSQMKASLEANIRLLGDTSHLI